MLRQTLCMAYTSPANTRVLTLSLWPGNDVDIHTQHDVLTTHFLRETRKTRRMKNERRRSKKGRRRGSGVITLKEGKEED